MPPERDPAGWYPDPYRQEVERYWTGNGWGSGTRPRLPGRSSARRASPKPVASAPAPSPESPLARFWPVLSIAAGAVMVAGSFLPWATISGTFGKQGSMRGTSGAVGWASVAFGLVIVAAGAVSVPRPRRLATVAVDLGALAASVLTIYEFVHITSQSGVLSSSNAVGIYDIGIGIGLGLVAVAAVVSLIGAAGMTGRDARSTLTE